MTDFQIRPKKFRKRKKHLGKEWSPDRSQLEAAKRDGGIICRECHKVRPWRRLSVRWETRSGMLYRLWDCDQCGNTIRIDEVGRTNTALTSSSSHGRVMASSTGHTAHRQEREMNMAKTELFSAKEAAIQLGTDARTLRKLIRSGKLGTDACGQGSRYEFTARQIKDMKKKYEAFSKSEATAEKPATKSTTKSKPKKATKELTFEPDNEVEEIELEDLDDPDADELDEDDVEVDDED